MKPTNTPALNGGAATAVASHRPRQPATPRNGASEPTTLMAAICAAATNPEMDVAKVEHLIKLHRELETQANERAFNEALAAAQAGMQPIGTNATNPHANNYKYATYAALDRAIRPIYSQHGLALTFTTGERSNDTAVEIVAYLIGHGHSRRYALSMPADGKGARGGDVMSRTHATASACSYGMRYLAVMIFNLSIDRDDDGNAAGGKAKSSASLKRSGVWGEFEADMRGARSLRDLEAVCNRWRPRMANWSHGYRTAAVELKGQQIERLGGTLAQLQETADQLDPASASRADDEDRVERRYETWRRP